MTSYLSRKALNEVSKDIVLFRAHSASLHNAQLLGVFLVVFDLIMEINHFFISGDSLVGLGVLWLRGES